MAKHLLGSRPHPQMQENRLNPPASLNAQKRAAIARLTAKYGLKEKSSA